MNLCLHHYIDKRLIFGDIGHDPLGDSIGVFGSTCSKALDRIERYGNKREEILFEKVIGLILVNIESVFESLENGLEIEG